MALPSSAKNRLKVVELMCHRWFIILAPHLCVVLYPEPVLKVEVLAAVGKVQTTCVHVRLPELVDGLLLSVGAHRLLSPQQYKAALSAYIPVSSDLVVQIVGGSVVVTCSQCRICQQCFTAVDGLERRISVDYHWKFVVD